MIGIGRNVLVLVNIALFITVIYLIKINNNKKIDDNREDFAMVLMQKRIDGFANQIEHLQDALSMITAVASKVDGLGKNYDNLRGSIMESFQYHKETRENFTTIKDGITTLLTWREVVDKKIDQDLERKIDAMSNDIKDLSERIRKLELRYEKYQQ